MEPQLGEQRWGPDQRPHPRISALEPGQLQSQQEGMWLEKGSNVLSPAWAFIHARLAFQKQMEYR